MIKATFKAYATYVTDHLYQWDINQQLRIIGIQLDSAPVVHFTNANMDRAIVKQVAAYDSSWLVVDVPNSLLQEPFSIQAYIGIYTGNTFSILEKVEIPVIPRNKPYDYTLDANDEEVYSFNELETALTNIDHNVNTAIDNFDTRLSGIIANKEDTTQNAELLDIRFCSDGETYSTAGDAVRGQIADRDLDLELIYETLFGKGETVKEYTTPNWLEHVIPSMGLNKSTGDLEVKSGRCVTNFIKVDENKKYSYAACYWDGVKTEYNLGAIIFMYDKNKKFLKAPAQNGFFGGEKGVKYVRFEMLSKANNMLIVDKENRPIDLASIKQYYPCIPGKKRIPVEGSRSIMSRLKALEAKK